MSKYNYVSFLIKKKNISIIFIEKKIMFMITNFIENIVKKVLL